MSDDNQQSFDRCVRICEKVLDLTSKPEDVVDGYVEWSKTYHQDMQKPLIKYVGPKNTALELQKVYPDKKDVYILDTPCGTGLVAQNLRDLGYTNIDALDINDGMLSVARKNNFYKKLMKDYLGPNKLNIPDNTYDAITSCGSFYRTHVQGDCFPELIRVVKPGGYIIVMTGEDDEVSGAAHVGYIAELDSLAAHHEAAGKWKKVARKVLPVPEYFHEDRGALFVYQVL